MSTSGPLSEIVFFTDRDLGKKFPAKLREAGIQVQSHGDHFAPDTPDDEWLAVVGDRGWVVLTHDTRIRWRPNELAAVVRHRVRLLVVGGKAPLPVLAESFVATLARVATFLKTHNPPFIARVYRGPVDADGRVKPGSVEQKYP